MTVDQLISEARTIALHHEDEYLPITAGIINRLCDELEIQRNANLRMERAIHELVKSMEGHDA